jgi:hypothetical protein
MAGGNGEGVVEEPAMGGAAQILRPANFGNVLKIFAAIPECQIEGGSRNGRG